MTMQSLTNFKADLTIAQSGTESTAFYLNGGHLVGFRMPSGWDTATIAYQGAMTGTTEPASGDWQTIYADGGDLAETVAAAKSVQVSPTKVYGWDWIRLKASAAQTTAARTITVVAKVYR